MSDLKRKSSASRRMLPVIAVVGRPNVGKSSLFNILVGRRMSIVHEESGVTRDRVVSPATHRGTTFELVDTGGLGMLTGETRKVGVWDARIEEQVLTALESADVLIMVTNAQDGILTLDREVANRLRTSGKPVILAVNKCDNPDLHDRSYDFCELGFEDFFAISCMHRSGISALMDKAISLLPDWARGKYPEEEDAPEPFRIAVAGRPNVGKSSLVNALLGEERVIVSDVAGTTRDAIDIDFTFDYQGEPHPAVLVDTAGLRRRGKVDTVVEYFSVMRSAAAIKRANLVLFLVEAGPDGVTAQDRRIAAQIEESGKGCILVANKLDLCDDGIKRKEMEEELRYNLPGMNYAPLVFISAKNRTNLGELLDRMAEVLEMSRLKISTALLNRVLADAFAQRTPPVVGHSPLKLYYAAMVDSEPPRFLLFVNDPKNCADNYLIYLRNMLRRAFDLTGLPVEIKLRARPKKVESFHSPDRSTSRRPRRKKS